MADPIRVLITDGMAPEGVKILEADSGLQINLQKAVAKEDLPKALSECECVVIRSATTLTGDLIEGAPNLKLIVRAGAGVDNIDVKKATEKGIPVMNTASANSLAAAEQTIALMFAMLRNLTHASASLSAGKWERNNFKGYEATDKTLAVIGLGNIGRIVAEKALGLGMKVVGYDPVIKSTSQLLAASNKLAKHEESISVVKELDEALKVADLVTLHVPKVAETKNLINSDTISKMKKGSFLINCARGGIVNEADVNAAVESGHLQAAAFDVFDGEPPNPENPILKNPKITCVPHLGASTFEAQLRVGITAANQIVGFFGKGDRTGVIN